MTTQIIKNLKFLKENNIKDEFIDSLENSFMERSFLSEKQQEILQKKVSNFKLAQKLFSQIGDEVYFSKLYNSLKEQFETKRFLTDKQLQMLNNIVMAKV